MRNFIEATFETTSLDALRMAARSIGIADAKKMSRKAVEITLAGRHGFDGIQLITGETPQLVKAIPVKRDLRAVSYLAGMGIPAHQVWRKDFRVYLKPFYCDPVEKLTAYLGKPVVINPHSYTEYLFCGPEEGTSIVVTDYGTNGYSIVLVNEFTIDAAMIKAMASQIIAFWKTAKGMKLCKTANEPFRATVDKLFPNWEDLHGDKAVTDGEPEWRDEDAYNSLITAVEILDI